MRQRLVGTLLWFVLLVPIVGTIELLWAILRRIVWMRQPALPVLVGFLVVLGSTPRVSAELSTAGIETLWSSFLAWGVPFIGVVVLAFGASSRTGRNARRLLQSGGWFMG